MFRGVIGQAVWASQVIAGWGRLREVERLWVVWSGVWSECELHSASVNHTPEDSVSVAERFLCSCFC